MSEMTLNEEVAVEVMGWERLESGSWLEYNVKVHLDWKPDEDLNQARMVTEKGLEIVGTRAVLTDAMATVLAQENPGIKWASSDSWQTATPEQICQAVLMAVREARK